MFPRDLRLPDEPPAWLLAIGEEHLVQEYRKLPKTCAEFEAAQTDIEEWNLQEAEDAWTMEATSPPEDGPVEVDYSRGPVDSLAWRCLAGFWFHREEDNPTDAVTADFYAEAESAAKAGVHDAEDEARQLGWMLENASVPLRECFGKGRAAAWSPIDLGLNPPSSPPPDDEPRKKPRYKLDLPARNIDELGTDEILAAIRGVLARDPELDREDLIRRVAEGLGYSRLGSRISERLNEALAAAGRRRITSTEGGIVGLLSPTIEDYPREELVQYLLAAMREAGGPAAWDQAEAIQYAARYLGFRRTGERIQRAFKGAINSAIRRRLIERDGSQIRRAGGAPQIRRDS